MRILVMNKIAQQKTDKIKKNAVLPLKLPPQLHKERTASVHQKKSHFNLNFFGIFAGFSR